VEGRVSDAGGASGRGDLAFLPPFAEPIGPGYMIDEGI